VPIGTAAASSTPFFTAGAVSTIAAFTGYWLQRTLLAPNAKLNKHLKHP
jgi:hypothetical protein